MRCKSCGREINESIGYCIYCELKHTTEDKMSKDSNDLGYNEIKCKKCANSLCSDMSFCPYCGSSVKEEKDGFLRRIKSKFVSYTCTDVERNNSLILFIESCLCLSFFLLGLYSIYSMLISGIDIILYISSARFLELLFRVIYFVGSFIVFSVSLRGYREIKKLVKEAKESETSFKTLLYVFIGGFAFFGMMVSSFLG